MPPGQSFTIWFPELKEILRSKYKLDSSIPDHFKLVEILNKKLTTIRRELKVKPPIFWCKQCNKRHESVLRMVTITAMYFALERFELCSHKEHLELKRNWKKYSKIHSIDINGKNLDDIIEEKHGV